MIKVEFKYVDDKFSYLKIQGHANSAEYGHDLICAGVSAIVIGALNNIDTNNYEIKIKEGLTEVQLKNENTTHDNIVFETMYFQLKTIEESYPKNIKIIK